MAITHDERYRPSGLCVPILACQLVHLFCTLRPTYHVNLERKRCRTESQTTSRASPLLPLSLIHI